ncbi:MAG: aspartate-semialdehyde dehydrogenase [SAR202 cluster bacterium]|nr:aspartate-semialdehyde dehydrogenase [SAR202 cluster bacterium]HAE32500.1 aspartate-semialdehyde dehydrogenase [Dehalococcoidia bacterium]
MNSCNVAVIGATGAVGQVFLRIAEERDFPVDKIRLCASERSIGKKLEFRGEQIEVELCTPDLLDDVDFSFISASGEVSRELAPLSVKHNTIAIDDSSAFRMAEGVPLVVPEVNADDLEEHKGIVSIPNCSTTPLVMVLKPLSEISTIKRVIVDTFQSVTGTGSAALKELEDQSRQILNGKPAKAEEYPHQIAFNVLPHIEPFLENGYTREEMKMVNETRKILHDSKVMVSATCVRVPVAVSHSEAIHIEFDNAVSPDRAREVLGAQPGITIVDDPLSNVYPMPIDAADTDDVLVGRVRKDVSNPNGLALWVVCDNLRKGAALNAIQIAEEMMQRDIVSPSTWR